MEQELNTNKFATSHVSELRNFYEDEDSRRNRYDQGSAGYGYGRNANIPTPEEVVNMLANADKEKCRITSEKLYMSDPNYQKMINYLANIFLYRWTVVPHRNTAKRSRVNDVNGDYLKQYGRMIEVVDGLHLTTFVPKILTQLLVSGAVFFTTVVNKSSDTIDTIIIPRKYAKNIGQTNFGTSVISMDMSYFDGLGLTPEQLDYFLDSFSAEIKEDYLAYRDNKKNRWFQLDPRYSSCLMVNSKGIPTMIAAYKGIYNYQEYSKNELEANTNKLRRIVWHKMPIYEDKLIFTVPETQAIHRSMAAKIEVSNKTRLLTTYGELHVESLADDTTTENNVLSNGYKSIFHSGGLNDAIFTGESVTALEYSLTVDKSVIWNYVEQLMIFYNLVVNNYYEFGAYEANISMLRISPYSYAEDIETYRANASLGVGKIDYIVATGISQKNIPDQLELESYLKLDQLKPLQSSYTQSTSAGESAATPEKDTSNSVAATDEDKKTTEVSNEKTN